MILALDTNRYSDLASGLPQVVQQIATADRILLPFVVLAELRAGFALGRRGAEAERGLSSFLAKPGVEVLLPDDQTSFHYARVYRQLRLAGTPIPTNDLWIAALVLQHNVVLHTRDEHFKRIPQLVTV